MNSPIAYLALGLMLVSAVRFFKGRQLSALLLTLFWLAVLLSNTTGNRLFTAVAGLLLVATLVTLFLARRGRDPMVKQVDQAYLSIWQDAPTPLQILFADDTEYRDRFLALGPEALPALTAKVTGQLKTRSDYVQATVIQALGEMGNSETASHLEAVLEDPDTESLLKKYLLAALVTLDPGRGLPRLRSVFSEGLQVTLEEDEPSDEAKEAAQERAQLLKSASSVLAKVAESPPEEAKDEILDLLISCLDSNVDAVRGNAVGGLRRMRDESSRPRLAAALVDDGFEGQAGQVAGALLAVPGGLDEVISAWPRLSLNAKQRVVRELADQEVLVRGALLGLLEQAASEDDEDLRDLAVAATKDLSDERVTQLLMGVLARCESYENVKRPFDALLERGEADRLLAAWPDLDQVVRASLVRLMSEGHEGEQRAQRVELLRRALVGDDDVVAMMAADTVAEINELELLPEVEAALPRLERAQQRLQGERQEAAIANLPKMAEVHVLTAQNTFGKTLAYDEASFAALDEMVQEGWPEGGGPMLMQTYGLFAAYFGETIRKLHGGQWDVQGDEELVLVGIGGEEIELRPLPIAERCLEGSSGESFVASYQRVREAMESSGKAVLN